MASLTVGIQPTLPRGGAGFLENLFLTLPHNLFKRRGANESTEEWERTGAEYEVRNSNGRTKSTRSIVLGLLIVLKQLKGSSVSGRDQLCHGQIVLETYLYNSAIFCDTGIKPPHSAQLRLS